PVCIKFAGKIADSLDQLRVFAGVGASMSKGIRISRSVISAFCAIAVSGCTAAMVPSQRFHEPEYPHLMSGPVQLGGQRFGMQVASDCAPCEDRQRLQDYVHRAKPYVAGPFLHPGGEASFAPQATIQPPHSKFHPVPTRPVFETPASYHALDAADAFPLPTPGN
ncbi:MAG: hypothetical protein WD070_08150, partial [Pirellulaceae bacterium]